VEKARMANAHNHTSEKMMFTATAYPGATQSCVPHLYYCKFASHEFVGWA